MTTQVQSATSTAAAATLWAGIDVAKKTVEVALDGPLPLEGRPAELATLPVASFPRSQEGAAEMAAWLAKQAGARYGLPSARLRVVMESTGGYCIELARWISQAAPGLEPAIVNAARAREFTRSLTPRSKTDKSDARALARLGTFQRPDPFEMPSEAQRALTALVRCREGFVSQRTALKNQLGGPGVLPEVAKALEKMIDAFSKEIAKLDKKIAKAIARDEQMKADAELLRTIPGVGPVVVATVFAELGDLRRFARARQLTAFAGLAPRRRQSGTSLDTGGPISKIGSSRGRRVLLPAVWAALRARGGDCFRLRLERLLKGGKSRLQGHNALMRQMLVLMRAMLISGEPFDPARV